MKKFVVVPGKDFYYFSDIDDADIYIEEEPFLSIKNKFLSTTERLLKKINAWRLYSFFCKSWKEKLEECDSCVIFDQAFSPAIVRIIESFNPDIQINVYLWNPVFKDISILKRLDSVKSKVNIFSFDRNDCKNYGFSFSPMIYNFNVKAINNSEPKYDVVFVGYMKNRAKMLIDIYNKLQSANASVFYYVLDNVNTVETTPFELHNDYLSYPEYKKCMFSSKAVLDIVQDGQVGLTIRTMETICYRKKLITNNTDVINYDFYNPDNIFVIGKDDINDLNEFINRPFIDIPDEILIRYNFCDWVKSF